MENRLALGTARESTRMSDLSYDDMKRTIAQSVANDIVKAFTQLRDAMHAAAAKASSLPTDSASSYKTAAQALNANVRASLNNIDASGLSNPDIEQAAAKVPVCKSLSSG